MKITDEMIQRMELDPYDDWDTDWPDNPHIGNVGITGIEQDVRDYFNIQSDEWPDSYVNMYVDINPSTSEAISMYVHVDDGFDQRHDKCETIRIPKKYGKRMFNQLRDSNIDLREEFLRWMEELKEEKE